MVLSLQNTSIQTSQYFANGQCLCAYCVIFTAAELYTEATLTCDLTGTTLRCDNVTGTCKDIKYIYMQITAKMSWLATDM